MKKPLISVIVPVYNVEKFLPKCLDSIKFQTYKNLEIILINDASTDRSGTFCDLFKKLDSRAVVIHKKSNAGLSAARNTGLKRAHGEFITFIDSDDAVAPDFIEQLYSSLLSAHSYISVCSHFEVHDDDSKKSFNSAREKSATLSIPNALKRMLNERGFMLSAWGKLYRRELFDTLDFFPVGKLHEDVATTYRLFLRAYSLEKTAKISFVSVPLYYYRLRSTSITNLGFNPKKLDLIRFTDEMCEKIDQTFPRLRDTTNLRRLHARFSILRQIIHFKHKTGKYKKLENLLVSYILEHKTWISKNPEASRRDKLALFSLRLGVPFFGFSWRLYSKFFK